jgi:hypothetical protein
MPSPQIDDFGNRLRLPVQGVINWLQRYGHYCRSSSSLPPALLPLTGPSSATGSGASALRRCGNVGEHSRVNGDDPRPGGTTIPPYSRGTSVSRRQRNRRGETAATVQRCGCSPKPMVATSREVGGVKSPDHHRVPAMTSWILATIHQKPRNMVSYSVESDTVSATPARLRTR